MVLLRQLLSLAKRNKRLLALVAFTVLFGLLLLYKVIVPAYREPTNRTYTSRFGYPAVMRKLGRPMPVTTAHVERRLMQKSILGEGLLASEPILVPVVPMDKIIAVHVRAGDRVTKGQLLAELDSTRAEIKLSSAKLAIETAQAELERVRIGSAYVLAQERPTKDIIDAKSAAHELELLNEKIRIYEQLFTEGLISKKEMLDARLLKTEAERAQQLAEFNLSMSSQGVKQSVLIAGNAVRDAENAFKQRQEELKGYKVHAPADGIIERVLMHEGEYNQDAGKPGFVIASGLWFEAHLDQSAINEVQEGDAVEMQLEALPGEPVMGSVRRIIPIVSFNTGGPESTRPIRPLGTGAPEWPSTFTVRVALHAPPGKSLAPGLTGFARVMTAREELAVPQAAVLSLSAGSGLVHVLHADQREVRQVRCGVTADGWISIRSGLREGERIIAGGHEVLQASDRIREEPAFVAAKQ